MSQATSAAGSLASGILPLFDQIVDGTKKHLAAIPDDRLDWKPHEKSYSVRELGSHLANIPAWTRPTVGQDVLDMTPDEGSDDGGYAPPPYTSSAEMVDMLENNAADAREAIAETSDETFMTNWTLVAGGEEKFTAPKIAVVRAFILDHMIHHRAQLTVYLRLLDVPVQQTFGPTADFPDM